MSTTPEGITNPEAPNPQLPVVQKLRLRYAKRGRLRFTSHRDFSRSFERAVRRAGLPIGYSSGFTPHPKISYAGASPTGAASEAEYLEIGLTRPCDPQETAALLDEALPVGLDVVAIEVSDGRPMAESLQASLWRIEVREVTPQALQKAVAVFDESEHVLVERLTKKGVRELDVRDATVSLRVGESDSDKPCAILELVVRHDTPSVRPDDVIAGLRLRCGLEVGELAFVATRLAQGPLDSQTGMVGDLIATGRDASQGS